MSDFVEIASTGDLRDGTMKKVRVGERDILVAQANGRYYAAESRCPHMGGDLSRGLLEGTIVTCPSHHSRFDLADGRVVRWTDWSGIALRVAELIKSPRPLVVYEVKVEGDRILARL